MSETCCSVALHSAVGMRERERRENEISKSKRTKRRRRRRRKAQRQYCPRGGNAWQADKHNFTAFFSSSSSSSIAGTFCYISVCFSHLLFFFLLQAAKAKRGVFSFSFFFNCQLSVVVRCVVAFREKKDRRLLYGRQRTTPGGSFKQSIDKTNSFNRPSYLFISL